MALIFTIEIVRLQTMFQLLSVLRISTILDQIPNFYKYSLSRELKEKL